MDGARAGHISQGRARSMQPEHPVDRAQFRGLDHLGMGDGHRMQVAVQGFPPEIEEALKFREVRTQVIGLPYIGLQQPGMIRTTVEYVGGRQTIAGELLSEAVRYHAAAPPPQCPHMGIMSPVDNLLQA
jgi:hypothetical protein